MCVYCSWLWRRRIAELLSPRKRPEGEKSKRGRRLRRGGRSPRETLLLQGVAPGLDRSRSRFKRKRVGRLVVQNVLQRTHDAGVLRTGASGGRGGRRPVARTGRADALRRRNVRALGSASRRSRQGLLRDEPRGRLDPIPPVENEALGARSSHDLFEPTIRPRLTRRFEPEL